VNLIGIMIKVIFENIDTVHDRIYFSFPDHNGDPVGGNAFSELNDIVSISVLINA